MTEMGAENEKQTDANGDDAVIDGVGKTVTENEEVEEIETESAVTAGNAGNDDGVVVGVGNAGDACNESDGSNDSESEHDEQNTRDIEEDGQNAGQDDGSSTYGTFAGFSGFLEASKSQSGSGSGLETDRYMYTISGTETCNL